MREAIEKIRCEIPLPEEVHTIFNAFKENNASLLVVGGSVRDFHASIIDNIPFVPKDFDLVTEVHPDRVVEILRKKGILVKEVGKSFGVVLAKVNDKDFEIATFREDSKTGDGRRPDSVTFSTMDKDAERRDLTINALFHDIGNKVTIDFFGGIQDLYSKRVRFVGDVMSRIHEDKLRILRFVRFHCRVNKGGPETLDKETRRCIRTIKLRPEISGERIRDEFLKGLESCLDKRNFLKILTDLDLLNQIFPNLQLEEVQNTTFSTMEALVAQILRYNMKKNVQKALLDLKFTVEESRNTEFLIDLPCWKSEDEIVAFRRAFNKTSLLDHEVAHYAAAFSPDSLLIQDMLKAPFPTTNGNIVQEETGLERKALGDEINRREVANFKEFRKNSLV